MLTKYVMPGEKVEIATILKAGSSKERKVYHTKVFDVENDEEVKLVMPMEQGKLILLSIDAEYDVCFYTKNGLYQAFARVSDRYKSNNTYVVNMELTSNLRKHQRREYYRLNCVLEMKCTCISEQQEVEIRDHHVEFIDTDLTVLDGTIVDISGGGVRFISNTRFSPEEIIQFTFSLKGTEGMVPYTLVGKILRTEEIDNRPGEYESRVMFTTIDAESRESIIKYIFEEQRKIRRRAME